MVRNNKKSSSSGRGSGGGVDNQDTASLCVLLGDEVVSKHHRNHRKKFLSFHKRRYITKALAAAAAGQKHTKIIRMKRPSGLLLSSPSSPSSPETSYEKSETSADDDFDEKEDGDHSSSSSSSCLTKKHNSNDHLVLENIIEESPELQYFLESEYFNDDDRSPTKKISLGTYEFVLSIDDINLNTIALQKLILAVRPPQPPKMKDSRIKRKDHPSRDILHMANIVVYGGFLLEDEDGAEDQQQRQLYEEFRFRLMEFVCNPQSDCDQELNNVPHLPHGDFNLNDLLDNFDGEDYDSDNDNEEDPDADSDGHAEEFDCLDGNVEESLLLIDDDEEEEYDCDDEESQQQEQEQPPQQQEVYPHGSNSGVLHLLALKVITSALYQIVEEEEHHLHKNRVINFQSDPFWIHIVETLHNNLEMNYSTKITWYTLKCWRLLYTLEPSTVGPYINFELMPYLLHLQSEPQGTTKHRLDIEASRLLKVISKCKTTEIMGMEKKKKKGGNDDPILHQSPEEKDTAALAPVVEESDIIIIDEMDVDADIIDDAINDVDSPQEGNETHECFGPNRFLI